MNVEGMDHQLTRRQKMYLPVKKALDIAICLPACVLLAPVMAGVAAAIKWDSSGPVLFKQKRLGKDKVPFEIWKFRTMRTDTPKNMPTHMLDTPEMYITRVGRWARKNSIDELPQLYQCLLTNNLSLVGPRPALWNQSDLIAERDKYGANSIKPGITGWAQINGRDILEIQDKARLDGEYVEKFGLWMDIKCFLGTIGSVLSHDGVVEGGTGKINKKKKGTSDLVSSEKIKKEIMMGGAVLAGAAAGGISGLRVIIHYCSGKTMKSNAKKYSRRKWLAGSAALSGIAYMVNKNNRNRVVYPDNLEPVNSSEDAAGDKEKGLHHRKILITGANSYIGVSLENWLKTENEKLGKEVYHVATLDMLDENWHKHDFSQYDAVCHAAGIAHADVGKVTEEQKQLYYKINTDLSVEVAEKAKTEGVKQFIFLSSMIVYSGCKEKMITKNTIPSPSNFYGDSKWQADKKIQKLSEDSFRTAIIRPPMVYGHGCKGNYSTLAKLAIKLPAFPAVNNRRSMLHIDNLCQFIKVIIDNQEFGVFFPQNGEYANTSDLVRMIAEVKGHRIWMIPCTNMPVKLLGKFGGKVGKLANKAFGDLVYDMKMSEYKVNYRVYSLDESIRKTECD